MDSQSIQSSDSSSGSMKLAKKAEEEREGWRGTLDFILTCIGYAVGLGNIWRFPYLCYKSGGGAFFIPYVIFLCLCGVPLFFLETAYGQFSSLSPIAVWRMVPMFKGVGVGMVMVSGLVCVYYNVIVAWTLYYLFMSFRAVLPWSSCSNSWNTVNCVDVATVTGNGTNTSSFVNGTNMTAVFYSVADVSRNITTKMVSSSEEFWERHVLELTNSIEEPGVIRWQLVITLILAWVCVFFCLFKGVRVLGPVMHFCAPFPYLVLLVLLIRGVTLPGAVEGIKFYIIPRWEKLATFQVWGDAALQIFYSVGMAWGGIITMASYNDFKHNVYRDAMIVPVINCGTSIFAGFVIFSVLGFMANESGKSVAEVVTQGPGLTFVAYPEAVSMLPISPLWAVLFFLMLFIIGLDSQDHQWLSPEWIKSDHMIYFSFGSYVSILLWYEAEFHQCTFGMFETCLSAIIDEFPHLFRTRRVQVAAIACIVEFILGLPLITQGGIYVLQIIDWYCASFSLMLISFTECMAISWVYGVDRFYKDIELMLGFQPTRLWSYAWRFVTPVAILFIWLFSVITLGPVTYGEKSYPHWAVVFGWCLGVCSIIPIPLIAGIQIYRQEGTMVQRVKKLLKPNKEWGPRKEEHRELYLQSLQHDDVMKNGYVLAPMDSNNVVKRNTIIPEEKTLLA